MRLKSLHSTLAATLTAALVLCSPPSVVEAGESGSDQSSADDAQKPTASESASESDDSKSDGDVDSISDLPTAKKKKLLQLLDSASKDFSEGNFEEVVAQMEKAYEIYPDPEFLYRIALSHEKTGNKRKAARYYEEYLEKKPESKKRGQVERSLEELRKTIRAEQKTENQKRDSKRQERNDQTDTGQSSQSLPIVLTSIGGAMTGASVTFGVLNLQAKSTADSLRESRGSDGNSYRDFESAVRRQNLYAALTYGTGALAAGALTWALIEWSTSPSASRDSSGSSSRASAGSEPPTIRLHLRLGPRSVGVAGSF